LPGENNQAQWKRFEAQSWQQAVIVSTSSECPTGCTVQPFTSAGELHVDTSHRLRHGTNAAGSPAQTCTCTSNQHNSNTRKRFWNNSTRVHQSGK